MQSLKVAGRYAQALLELSTDKKAVDKVFADMKLLLSTTNDNRDFLNFLNSPLIKADKKAKVLHRLFEGFHEISSKFIELLTKNTREMYLPLIAEDFINRVNDERGIVALTFISAQELDKATKENILSKLNKRIKGAVELTEKIDNDLIGGFIVRMGDTQIDASVSYQLNKMKQRLMQ